MSTFQPKITHITTSVARSWLKMSFGLLMRIWYISIPLSIGLGFGGAYASSNDVLEHPLMTIAVIPVGLVLYCFFYGLVMRADDGKSNIIAVGDKSLKFFNSLFHYVLFTLSVLFHFLVQAHWAAMGSIYIVLAVSLMNSIGNFIATTRDVSPDSAGLIATKIKVDTNVLVLIFGAFILSGPLYLIFVPLAVAASYVIGREIMDGGGNKARQKQEVRVISAVPDAV